MLLLSVLGVEFYRSIAPSVELALTHELLMRSNNVQIYNYDNMHHHISSISYFYYNVHLYYY